MGPDQAAAVGPTQAAVLTGRIRLEIYIETVTRGPFDFGDIERRNTIGEITDPATLFEALPSKASGYGYLRSAQKEVLDAWSKPESTAP